MLILNNKSRRQYTAGEMVNLMSVDATKVQEMMARLNGLWFCPFQILVTIFFLYRTMGWSIFAGVAVLVLLIPLHVYISKKAEQFQVRDIR